MCSIHFSGVQMTYQDAVGSLRVTRVVASESWQLCFTAGQLSLDILGERTRLFVCHQRDSSNHWIFRHLVQGNRDFRLDTCRPATYIHKEVFVFLMFKTAFEWVCKSVTGF